MFKRLIFELYDPLLRNKKYTDNMAMRSNTLGVSLQSVQFDRILME